MGLFAKHDIQVNLRREIGWASIREKLASGEVEAAHAPAAMLLQPWHDRPSPKIQLVSAYILNLQGLGITLSSRLAQEGVQSGADLAHFIHRSQEGRKFTFGIISRFSSHHILLLDWFRRLGIPRERVTVLVVPPAQMPRNLAGGTIDAFCAGEPWNTICALNGSGYCDTTSSDLHAGHPEKALVVRKDFADKRPDAHYGLINALNEAAQFCDAPENFKATASILSDYLALHPSVLEASLAPVFPFGVDRTKAQKRLLHFSGQMVNRPTLEKGLWLRNGLMDAGLIDPGNRPSETEIAQVFREDLYEKVLGHREALS